MSKPRPLLKPDQWPSLLDIPVDEDSLIRNCTLNRDDVDLILLKRTPHNRLGLALQICFLRVAGRSLLAGEIAPAPLVSFVAQQIGVDTNALADAARRETNRREHSVEAQRHLHMHPAAREDRRVALTEAIAAAAASDKGLPIAVAFVASFRRRQAVLPAASTLDRLGRAARAIARRQMEGVLLDGLGVEELSALDGLLEFEPSVQKTRFGWLRDFPETPSERNLLGLIERLKFVRDLKIAPQKRDRIHPDRWAQQIREGAVTPSWLAQDFNQGRRRALVAAQIIELSPKLTDATIAMFCRLIAKLFTRSKARQDQSHLDSRKEAGRMLRMFGDTLRALAEANETGEDAFDVLDRHIGWHRLVQARGLVDAMTLTAEADPLIGAAERYPWVRRYASAFLEAFVFRSDRANETLLKAVELLRQLNRDDRRALPSTTPVAHLKDKVRKTVRVDGKLDRRRWEIATLAVLRERLRAGEVWAEGGRYHHPLTTQLVGNEVVESRRQQDQLLLGVPADADAWIAVKQREMDFKLKRLSYLARTGKLEGVRLINGELSIKKPSTKIPKAKVDAAKWLILDRIPKVDITDLLVEVDGWTDFAGQFVHLRTAEAVRSPQALLAAILGDATNLGAKRMADASAGVSERQITWARLFHIRPETYRTGLATIINAQLAHPYSKLWGTGSTSSSDGQFFRASGRGAKRSDVNAHYGGDPGNKFYTWVSDQHGHFHILPMGATEDEAVYVLDGLYGHESKIEIEEHYVDTGGASDHVFSLFTIAGKRVAPRLRDLGDRRLHTFEGAGAYPTLKHHIGDCIDVAAIRDGWNEVLRVGVSIEDRVIAPSAVLKKLAALPKSYPLSKALREIGRIERTLFMIEWYSNPNLRDRCRAGLNKGEAGNKLTRAVFFHERGEIRDGSFESQAFRASGLNLVVSAIIYWNTVYMSRAVDSLRAEGHELPDSIIRHVSPQIWEHINLTGIYDWVRDRQPTGTFRPLRKVNEAWKYAA